VNAPASAGLAFVDAGRGRGDVGAAVAADRCAGRGCAVGVGALSWGMPRPTLVARALILGLALVVVPALVDEPKLIRAAAESGEVTALAVRADRIPAAVPSVKNSADRLSGRIPCVLGAARAQRLLVPVHHVDATSLWLVDSAAGGMGVHPRPLLDRSRDVADITLDDVQARRLDIDATAALGEIATRAAVLAAADALGASERMLQLAVDYSKQRQQFGQAIGNFQVLQHRMVDMYMELEQAVAAVYLAVLNLEAEPDARARAVSAAKATIGRAARFIGQQAVQLHGGMGMTEELAIGHYFKRLTALQFEFGSTDFHVARYAQLTKG